MSLRAELWASAEFIGATFVVVSAVGTAFQVAYFHKSKVPEVKAALGRWFDWVKDWRYKYFAQEEATRFVQILERWAGAVFWCKKRWLFASIVALSCALVSLLIVWALGVAGYLGKTKWEVAGALALMNVAGYVPVVALSVSVTRMLALLVAKLRLTKLTSAFAFGALVGFHLLLFVFWSRVVWFVGLMPITVAALGSSDMTLLQVAGRVLSVAFSNKLDMVTAFRLEEAAEPIDPLSYFFVMNKLLVDAVCNGVRIGFAVVFLGSYLLPVAVQTPLINAWSHAAESDQPLLGLVLGVAAAVLVTLWEAGYWLVRGVSYVIGLF